MTVCSMTTNQHHGNGGRQGHGCINTSMVKAHFWREEETTILLMHLKELNILNFLDGRKTRNGDLFRKVADQLREAGFIRSPEQIRVRWKPLKQGYNSAKRKNCMTGNNRVKCPFSNQLEELLGSRSIHQAADHSVNVGLNSESVAEIELEKTVKNNTHADSAEDSWSYSASDGASRSSTPLPDRDRSTPISSPPPPRLCETRPHRSARTHCCQCRDLDLVFQRIEEMDQSWRRQLQRSEERAERLVNSIIQSNTTMISALLESIKSLRPAVPQPTPPANPTSKNPSQAQHQGMNFSHLYGFNEYGY